MNWLRSRLPLMFGIDLRTLALFRAMLGGVLFADLCGRMADAGAFYSDAGVLPRSWLAAHGAPWRASLYLANGQTWFALALLALEALAALALLLGWRTRLATILCFVLQVSLLNRNELVLLPADGLLACLLFWSLFLPLGARWSVDASLATQPPPAQNLHLSWASAALLLQVVSVYFFGGVLQSGPEWWPEGSALYYALSLDQYAAPAGQWLRQYPALLAELGDCIHGLELAAPLLAFSPQFGGPLRFALLLLLLGLQLGILLCLDLGNTALVGIAALSPLAGGWIWDALERRGRRREAARGALPLRLYYDRDCAFCLKQCQLLRSFLILPRAQILPAQDYPRARALLEANRSWVVIDHDDHAYLKWPALALLLRRSPLLGWLGWLLSGGWAVVPGNAVYDFVARHRGGFARLSGLLLPYRDGGFASGALTQRLAAVFLFAVLAWNLCNAGWLPQLLGSALKPPLRLLRLDQRWDLFAPAPPRDDGWFVFPGELNDGTPLDVLRPKQSGISYDKPASIAGEYRNSRWQQYLRNLWSPQYSDNRPYYGRYLCRQWGRTHPSRQGLKDFKMIYMLEQSPPPGQVPSAVEQRILWRHECAAPLPGDTDAPLPLPVN